MKFIDLVFNKRLKIGLKEKVTPETVYFLYSPVKRPHGVELLTVV